MCIRDRGIVADIKQVVRLQNDVVRILVDGISRAALLGFTGNEKYLCLLYTSRCV